MTQKEYKKSFTPISLCTDKGFVDFLIKVYPENDQYPESGIVSRHLGKLEQGDYMKVSGPKISITYLGNGNFQFRKKNDLVKKYNELFFVCGGTGIAPYYNIIKHIEQEVDNGLPHNFQKITLLYCNKTDNDILLYEEIEKLREKLDFLDVQYFVKKQLGDVFLENQQR